MESLIHAVENLVTVQTAALFLAVFCFVIWLMVYCWKGDV